MQTARMRTGRVVRPGGRRVQQPGGRARRERHDGVPGADLPGAVGRLHQRPAHAPPGHLRARAPAVPQAHPRALGARRRRHRVHQLADAAGGEEEARRAPPGPPAAAAPARRGCARAGARRPSPGTAASPGRRRRRPKRQPSSPARGAVAAGPAARAVGTLVEVAAAHHPTVADAGHRAVHPAQVAAQQLAPATRAGAARRGRTGCGRPGRRRKPSRSRVTQSPPGTPFASTSITSAPPRASASAAPRPGGAASQHEGVGGGHARHLSPPDRSRQTRPGRPSPPPRAVGWAMLAAR